MTLKELLMRKIEEVPDSDPILQDILNLLENRSTCQRITIEVGRSLTEEAEWEIMWNEDHKRGVLYAPKTHEFFLETY